MEIDELKDAWRELDRRLEVVEERALCATRELKLGKAKRALRFHSLALFFELLGGVIAVLLVAWFLKSHYSIAKFALPAVVLEFAALLLFAENVAQFSASLRLDYSEPVLEIQRRIAQLRARMIRSTQWTLLFAPLLWTPLAIVAAFGLLDLDLYAQLGSSVIALNLSVGLAVIPLGIMGARICAARLEHSPLLKALADSIAGHNLNRAMESILELERFEQE